MNLLKLSVAAMTILVFCMPAAVAEDMDVTKSPPPGCGRYAVVKTPESNVEKPGDIGKRAHTNIEILVPCSPQSQVQPGGEGSGQPTPNVPPPR